MMKKLKNNYFFINRISLKKSVFFVCFFLLTSFLSALDVTWTGSEDNSWENPNNWDSGTLPTNSDRVIIADGSEVVLNSNVQINDLSISNNSKLTINASRKLTIIDYYAFYVSADSSVLLNGELHLNDECELYGIDVDSTGKVTSDDGLYISSNVNIPNVDVSGTTTIFEGNITCKSFNFTGDCSVKNVSCSGDIIVGGDLKINANLSTSGNITVGAKLTTNANVFCKRLTVTGQSIIGGNITTEEGQVYNDTFSFNKNITLETGYGQAVRFLKAINNTTNTLTINFDNGIVYFTGDNTFNNLTVNGNSTVAFDDHTFQKINGTLSLNGVSEDNRLNFGTNSEPFDIYFANTPIFSYVTIFELSSKNQDNTDSKQLNLTPSKNTFLVDDLNDIHDFIKPLHYFKAVSGNKWTTQANWFYDVDASIPSIVPDYDNAISEIIILDNNNLELNGDLSNKTLALKSLRINDDARFGLGSNSLSLSGTGTVLNNLGTFALFGESGQAIECVSGNTNHGDSSLIEYYGTVANVSPIFCVSSIGDSQNYKTLKINKTSGAITFEDSVIVSNLITVNTCTLTFNKNLSINSSGTDFELLGNINLNGALVINANIITNNATITATSSDSNFTINSDFINNKTIDLGIGTISFNGEFTNNASASINLNSSTTTFTKNVSNFGKFTASSEYTQFRGDVSLEDGNGEANVPTFTHNSGTVRFTGNANQNLNTSQYTNFYNVEISNSSTVISSSSFNVQGDKWENNKNFIANAGSINFSTTGTVLLVSGNNTFNDVTFTGSTELEISGNNTYNNLTIQNISNVKFGANRIQTINGNFTVAGTNANNTILTTNSASPSINNENTWWVLAGIPSFSTWGGTTRVNFSYVQIEYAKASNQLTHDWGVTVKEKTEDSTKNYFVQSFYWWGKIDSSWTEPENWSYSDSEYLPLTTQYPPIDTGKAIIEIVQNDSNILKLSTGTSYNIKSLEVKEDKTIDLDDCELTVAKDIRNNGIIKLKGSQSLIVSGSKINGNNSTIEYYGNCQDIPWGQFYQNLIFGTNANGNISTVITVQKETKFLSCGDISVEGNFNSSNTNAITIENAGQIQLKSTDAIYIKEDSSANSLYFDSPVNLLGNITTINEQTYNSSVILHNDITLLAKNTTILFNDAVRNFTSCNLTIGDSSTNQTNVIFNKNVGSQAFPLSSLMVYGTSGVYGNVYTTQNQTYQNQVTYNNDIFLNATFVQFKGGAIEGTTEPQNKLTINGKAYLNGSGNFGGGQGILINDNLYVGSLAGTVYIKDNVTVTKDVYISSNSTDTLQIDSPLSVQGNFALFTGNLNLQNNLFASKDIVLLNKVNANWQIDGNGTNGTSGKEIFVYNLNDRPKAPSLLNLEITLPDQVDPISTEYSSSLTIKGGITLQAGQNFFANGVNLTSTSAWNLILKDNKDSKNAFAELYNANISYCNVSCIDLSDNAVLATCNVTNGGNNTNVSFTIGSIKEAKTVLDDVIYISFVDQNDLPLLLENTNNEISLEFKNRIFYAKDDGSQITFLGTFIDKECTISTDGQENLSSFYIKALTTWNTDAKGNSSGDVQSTDRKGIHKSSIPYINLPRALENSYFGLKDQSKNRVYSFYSDSPSLATLNANKGATFTATKDECKPVLVSVAIGKEDHIDPQGNANLSNYSAEAQRVYDAHNYIQFTYSEAVDIGNGSQNYPSNGGNVNIPTSTNLGQITTNATNGLQIAGLCEIQKGKIDVQTTNASATSIHSLYRKFKDDDDISEQNQPHKIRLGIASFVSNTITVNSKKYYKWEGYIESATIPSGTITRIENNYIKDKESNVLDTSPDLVPLTLKQKSSSWDVVPPSFVPLRINGSEWNSSLKNSDQYEAVGATSGTNHLTAIEIHMFDNQPTYTISDSLQWFSKLGWASSIDNKNYTMVDSYAADQKGGIRYCTLYNLQNNFKYLREGQASYESFKNVNIKGGAESSLFLTAQGEANPTKEEDSCYFNLALGDSTNYDARTIFKISFNADSAYLTDLAGNRIKNPTGQSEYIIPTVDRSSPSVTMSVSPCGKDSLYVVFSKAINADKYKVYKDSSTSEEISALEYLPQSLQIQDKNGNFVDLIDQSVPATLAHKTQTATGFIIKLKREVDLQDITSNYRIVVKATTNVNHKYDTLSAISAEVTYIQDEIGNFAVAESKHAFTDFAVNVLSSDYAYNIGMQDSEGRNVQQSLYSDGSWAVHDWSRNQGNYGVLSPNYDVLLSTKFFDGTQDNSKGADSVSLKIHFDNNIDLNSSSTEYNRITGRSFRIWLPTVFDNIAPQANTCFTIDGTKLDPDSSPFHFNFVLPLKSDNTYESFKTDQKVTFLFELEGKTVDHFANGTESPLYVLRLENPNDITSLDLWSFNLKDTIKQRGGISVLNNVINPTTGEKSLIRTDFTSDSNVNIMVMTLDGNIVKYLNRGTVKSGEQYFTWDGRNTKGNIVARGLYFIRVVGNGIDETRKIMVVK